MIIVWGIGCYFFYQYDVLGKMSGDQYTEWKQWKVVSYVFILIFKNNYSILKEYIFFYKNEDFFFNLYVCNFSFLNSYFIGMKLYLYKYQLLFKEVRGLI